MPTDEKKACIHLYSWFNCYAGGFLICAHRFSAHADRVINFAYRFANSFFPQRTRNSADVSSSALLLRSMSTYDDYI